MLKQLSKKDYSILLANIIDHFDSALYGFLAPILAPLFFPHHDPIVSLIMAYSVYFTSLITRPIGVCLFGILAIKKNARKSLIYSLTGVAIFTGLIGLIPTYHQIGFWAPLLLVISRIIRDICSSGEITIARLYILENKDEKSSIRSSYIYQASTMLGIILASCVSTIIITFELNELWRLCFIIGSFAGLSALVLRYQDFNNFTIANTPPNNLKTRLLLKNIWQEKLTFFTIIMVFSFSYITYSISFILLNNLIPLITNHSLATMMSLNSWLLVFDFIALIAIGFIIEKYDIVKVMYLSAIILAITCIPLWYFLSNAPLWYVAFTRIWFVILGVSFACPINLWCYNQIKSDYKYSIVGLAESIGVAVFGKTNAAISLYIFHTTGTHNAIAVYLAIIFFITAILIKYNKA